MMLLSCLVICYSCASSFSSVCCFMVDDNQRTGELPPPTIMECLKLALALPGKMRCIKLCKHFALAFGKTSRFFVGWLVELTVNLHQHYRVTEISRSTGRIAMKFCTLMFLRR